jgi:hypothetical protein
MKLAGFDIYCQSRTEPTITALKPSTGPVWPLNWSCSDKLIEMTISFYCFICLSDGLELNISQSSFVLIQVKKLGLPPGPRAGFSICVHKKRALLFGGVVDIEVQGEFISSK